MSDIALTGSVRPKVICIFHNRDRILVIKAYDPTKKQSFYIPPGGGIEFGETSEVALRREMREELETDIENPRLLGVIENIFTFNGQQGHEIIFVYDAQLANRSLYDLPHFAGHESGGDAFIATWLELASLEPDSPPVYPEGLLEMIKNERIRT